MYTAPMVVILAKVGIEDNVVAYASRKICEGEESLATICQNWQGEDW